MSETHIKRKNPCPLSSISDRQPNMTSALSALMHCIAKDLIANFYDGRHRTNYNLNAGVFQFLSGRTQIIRADFFKLALGPDSTLTIWEVMMLDDLFFKYSPDPMSGIQEQAMYRDALNTHLKSQHPRNQPPTCRVDPMPRSRSLFSTLIRNANGERYTSSSDSDSDTLVAN